MSDSLTDSDEGIGNSLKFLIMGQLMYIPSVVYL